MFPSPWPAPSPGGDQRDRKRASEAQRTVQQLVGSRQDRETHTRSWPPCSVLSPRWESIGAPWGLGVGGRWVPKRRLQRTDSGRGLGLAVWRQAERAGVRCAPREYGGRNPRPPLKPHCYHARTDGGPEPTEASFSLRSRGRGMRALGQCTSASSLPTCGSKVGTQASPRDHAASDTGLKSECPDGCGICGFQGLQTCGQITAWLQVLWAGALRGGASVSGLTRGLRESPAVLAPDLCPWACTGSFVRAVPEGHQGHLPEFPRLRQGQGQC